MNNGTSISLSDNPLLPICYYLSAFNTFFTNANLMTINDGNQSVPVINALFEYLNKSTNESLAKCQLLKEALIKTNIYQDENTNMDVTYVKEKYNYIIYTVLFHQHENVTEYFSEIENVRENERLSVEDIEHHLSRMYIVNLFSRKTGSKKLTQLAIEKLLEYILPIYNQERTLISSGKEKLVQHKRFRRQTKDSDSFTEFHNFINSDLHGGSSGDFSRISNDKQDQGVNAIKFDSSKPHIPKKGSSNLPGNLSIDDSVNSFPSVSGTVINSGKSLEDDLGNLQTRSLYMKNLNEDPNVNDFLFNDDMIENQVLSLEDEFGSHFENPYRNANISIIKSLLEVPPSTIGVSGRYQKIPYLESRNMDNFDARLNINAYSGDMERIPNVRKYEKDEGTYRENLDKIHQRMEDTPEMLRHFELAAIKNKSLDKNDLGTQERKRKITGYSNTLNVEDDVDSPGTSKKARSMLHRYDFGNDSTVEVVRGNEEDYEEGGKFNLNSSIAGRDKGKSKRLLFIEKAANFMTLCEANYSFTDAVSKLKGYLLKLKENTTLVPSYDQLAWDFCYNLADLVNYQTWKIPSNEFIDDLLFKSHFENANTAVNIKKKYGNVFGYYSNKVITNLLKKYENSIELQKSMQVQDFLLLKLNLEVIKPKRENTTNERIKAALYRLAVRECEEDWIENKIVLYNLNLNVHTKTSDVYNYTFEKPVEFSSNLTKVTSQLDKLKPQLRKAAMLKITMENQAGIVNIDRLFDTNITGRYIVPPGTIFSVRKTEVKQISGRSLFLFEMQDNHSKEKKMTEMVKKLESLVNSSKILFRFYN